MANTLSLEVFTNHQIPVKQNSKDHISKVSYILKNEKGKEELVLGMDHNVDLLKVHEHCKMQQFLDLMLELELFLTIMRPTRITQLSATLIDNVFISSILQRSFDSLILLEDTSDHMPSLVLMKQTKLRDKKPLRFKSCSLNEAKLEHIKNVLKIKDWNAMLRSDSVDDNFDKFCEVVSEMMDKFAPLKEMNISWRQKYIEPWMTNGIEKASNKCKKLYKDSLTEGAGENTKWLWQVINSIVGKTKHSGRIIAFITIEGMRT